MKGLRNKDGSIERALSELGSQRRRCGRGTRNFSRIDFGDEILLERERLKGIFGFSADLRSRGRTTGYGMLNKHVLVRRLVELKIWVKTLGFGRNPRLGYDLRATAGTRRVATRDQPTDATELIFQFSETSELASYRMDTEDFPMLLPVLGLGLFEDGTKTKVGDKRKCDDNEGNSREKEELGISTEVGSSELNLPYNTFMFSVGAKLVSVSRSTEVVQKATKNIYKIRERLHTAQSRQNSYVDRRRPYLEFQVGDRVLLEVSLWKRMIRFRKRGKLGPRFIRPFTVLARMGRVAYRLELPEVFDLSRSTFHVSQLSKCLAGESAHIPLDDIQVGEGLNYVE
ncbi:hypothetical protein OSB04_000788 [Centaurea solstitialis]|uniref:Tf2-1-like SH3-like domain-containing protein n=1 Tax=Centaurea solstitialis TaxID=347529 RepID=A0AA38U840_9ASTR|nr:hypothetical protein OSB04_000788 [Centaurea solstitialis]